jgi:serine/threonine protein kinase
MNISVLDKFVSRFSSAIHINQLKLSDLTDKKAVRLTDKEMLLTDEASPNKFETETNIVYIYRLAHAFFGCLHGLYDIHRCGVIHRDIKPENLVIDDEGYLRITDFGIARVWRQENSSDTSGTPGYMAPEVMCRLNHTISVDYFAVGVMAYECMFGRRPYIGKSRKEILSSSFWMITIFWMMWKINKNRTCNFNTSRHFFKF